MGSCCRFSLLRKTPVLNEINKIVGASLAEREDTCVSQHKLTSVAVCSLNGNTHMQSHVAAAQHLTPDKPPLCFMFGRCQKENLLEDAANSDESAHLKATD